MSSDQIKLGVGAVELTVDAGHGCRISSLRIDGTEVLRQGDKYGCFPMVPWCGRVENGQFRDGGVKYQFPLNSPPHAIHGTARDHAWKTGAGLRTTEAVFTYELAEPWPFTGRVTQIFELTPDALTVTMGVETYDNSFPAQVGWHPWFVRELDGSRVELAFDAEWQEERGDDHLPTGRRHRAAAGALGRLLRDARRRRRHPDLAGAARTEGDQPHRVGRRLRRAGGGRVRGAAVGPAQRPQHPAPPGHPDRPAGTVDDLDLAPAVSTARKLWA